MKKMAIICCLFNFLCQKNLAQPSFIHVKNIIPIVAISPTPATLKEKGDRIKVIMGCNERSTANMRSIAESKKMRIFERLVFAIIPRKIRHQLAEVLDEQTDAEKKAEKSYSLAKSGLIFAFIPVLNIIAIPMAIIAIVNGRKAKKMGAKKRNGLGLAIAALVVSGLMTALLIFATSGLIV